MIAKSFATLSVLMLLAGCVADTTGVGTGTDRVSMALDAQRIPVKPIDEDSTAEVNASEVAGAVARQLGDSLADPAPNR